MVEFKITILAPTCGDVPDEDGEFSMKFDIQGPPHYSDWVLARALRELADEIEHRPGVQ